jgi:hypothetical protein
MILQHSWISTAPGDLGVICHNPYSGKVLSPRIRDIMDSQDVSFLVVCVGTPENVAQHG